MSWFDAIGSNIEHHNIATHELAIGGGRLLITQRGARIIACELPGADRNLFWHNPQVEQQDTADAVTGGDRLWIAPEIAYYWPSVELAREDPIKHAAKPEQVDPGDYNILHADERGIRLCAFMRLTDSRVDKQIAVEADREIRVIDPPVDLPNGLACGSFAITHTLTLRDGDAGAVAGGWSILKLPTTSTLIFPTVRRVESPTSYYEPFGDKHVVVDDEQVRFLGDAQRRVKLGLLAQDSTGRMGAYRRMADGRSSLIVRLFPVLPGEPYVDQPISADKSRRTGGDCIQAYNDGGMFGDFCEMEYHDAALIAGQSPSVRAGTCVTHVVVGEDEAVREAGRKLLGVSVEEVDA